MKKIILIAYSLYLMAGLWLIAYAAQDPRMTCGPTPEGNYRLCSEIPGIDEVTGIPDLIKKFFNFALAVGGTLAFILIIIGGITLILEGGNVIKQGEAKARITNAIIGLLLLMGSTLILYSINPELITIDEPFFRVPTESRSLEEVSQLTEKNLGAKAAIIEAKHQALVASNQQKMLNDENAARERLVLMQNEINALFQTPNPTPEQQQRLTQLRTDAPAQQKRVGQLEYNRLSSELSQVTDSYNQLKDTSDKNWQRGVTHTWYQWLVEGESLGDARLKAGLTEKQAQSYNQLVEKKIELLRRMRQLEPQLGIQPAAKPKPASPTPQFRSRPVPYGY